MSLGPEKAVDSLRKALAMGADRAVLVSDEAAAGSDLLGTAARSRARSSARPPTSSSSARPRATATAPCSGRPSPTGCAGPSISQVASLTIEADSVTGKRQTEHGYDVITRAASRRSSPSRTRSTSRATRRSRGSWARRRSRRRRSRSPTSASTRTQPARPARRRPSSSSAPPPSRGDQVKIEDDGTAAQKILDLVVERRLL